MQSKKVRLPETEAEWLSRGDFQIEYVSINGKDIRCALLQGKSGGRLITMVGGIPREVERRNKLPLINKLYGYLALILQECGVSSLLYNQPATGGSTGNWDEETLSSRTQVLAGLIDHFSKKFTFSDHGLIGSSSGAYMAINSVELIEKQGHKVSKLLLLSPAAYPKQIEVVPYGEKFTEILRQPWDVSTSPVFSKLRDFFTNGTELLLCFFENDDPPIPMYIQEYYRNFMWRLEEAGKNVSVITIPGVAHNFRRIQRKRGREVDDDSIVITAENFREFLK